MYGRPPDEIDWNRVAPDAIAIFGETESDGVDAGPDRTPRWRPSGFIEWFALGLTLLPALLFIPGSQAYRLPIRTGAYAISLFALALWWFHRGGEQRAKHPAGAWIGVTLLWVGLMILHPLTGSLLDRRGAIQSVCSDPVSGILGAIVCRLAAEAGAGARRAARLQRHQLGGRRHAGVRPRQLDAAAALVGVPEARAATDGSGRLHVHRAERPPHAPAARPVRCGRRGGGGRHGRHDPRPRLLPGADRVRPDAASRWPSRWPECWLSISATCERRS